MGQLIFWLLRSVKRWSGETVPYCTRTDCGRCGSGSLPLNLPRSLGLILQHRRNEPHTRCIRRSNSSGSGAQAQAFKLYAYDILSEFYDHKEPPSFIEVSCLVAFGGLNFVLSCSRFDDSEYRTGLWVRGDAKLRDRDVVVVDGWVQMDGSWGMGNISR
ncbi:hypothetical protein Hypma_009345 [Hypsizygus marmoreus]|uniref:Uncharacterized protein n=1 Tax=Hypsizygus marmoreus TaxID=39966 RepID=A0A369JXD3_HYPMA|nr:hypothetical protein Hypma_009345 [Hypsizygus marmoreus]